MGGEVESQLLGGMKEAPADLGVAEPIRQALGAQGVGTAANQPVVLDLLLADQPIQARGPALSLDLLEIGVESALLLGRQIVERNLSHGACFRAMRV